MSAAASVKASASEHVACQVDGHDFDVLTLTGHEAVSELFRYEVGCAATYEWADPEPLLGKPTRIEIRDGAGATRTISGSTPRAP